MPRSAGLWGPAYMGQQKQGPQYFKLGKQILLLWPPLTHPGKPGEASHAVFQRRLPSV